MSIQYFIKLDSKINKKSKKFFFPKLKKFNLKL